MLLRRIYVTDNNKMYVGLHVKCHIFLTNFNQIWSFLTDFHTEVPSINFHKNLSNWKPQWYKQTCGCAWQSWQVLLASTQMCLKLITLGRILWWERTNFLKCIPVTTHLLLVCPYHTPSPVTSSLLKCLSENLQGLCDTSVITMRISVWFIQ